jgi:hypothetical protein
MNRKIARYLGSLHASSEHVYLIIVTVNGATRVPRGT